jgi:hypothetical protein
LNDTVTAGNWSWWLTTSGALVTSAVASAEIGTLPPAPVRMPVFALPTPVDVAEFYDASMP